MRERKAKGRRLLLILTFILIPSAFVLVFWWFRGWNGRDPVNVVVSSGAQLWILAVRPTEPRLVEVSIPENLIVDVVGHGKWRASTLWRLSELENNPRIAESVGWDFLEVPVDGLIRTEKWEGRWSIHSLNNIFQQVKSMNFMCFLLVKFCEQHEWSLPETIRLVNFRRSLTDSQHTVIALQDEVPMRRIIDPGGIELIELDRSVLAPPVLDWFGVAEFRASELTVAVRNASGETGQAARVARLLEHTGLRIVGVGNGEGNPSIMATNDQDAQSFIVRRLSRWFNLPVVRAGELPERADVVVVI